MSACIVLPGYSVESSNKGHLRTGFRLFIKMKFYFGPLWEVQNIIRCIMGRKCLGTSSCVLCGEIVFRVSTIRDSTVHIYA